MNPLVVILAGGIVTSCVPWALRQDPPIRSLISPSACLLREMEDYKGAVLIDSSYFIYGVVRDWQVLLARVEQYRAQFIKNTAKRVCRLDNLLGVSPEQSDVAQALCVAAHLLSNGDRDLPTMNDEAFAEYRAVVNQQTAKLRFAEAVEVDWRAVGSLPNLYRNSRFLDEADPVGLGRLFLANEYLTTCWNSWTERRRAEAINLQERAWEGEGRAVALSLEKAFRIVFGSNRRCCLLGVVDDLRERVTPLLVNVAPPPDRWREAVPEPSESEGLFGRVRAIGRVFPVLPSPHTAVDFERWKRKWGDARMVALVGAYERMVEGVWRAKRKPLSVQARPIEVVMEPCPEVFEYLYGLAMRMDQVCALLDAAGGDSSGAESDVTRALRKVAKISEGWREKGRVDAESGSELLELMRKEFDDIWIQGPVVALGGIGSFRRGDAIPLRLVVDDGGREVEVLAIELSLDKL